MNIFNLILDSIVEEIKSVNITEYFVKVTDIDNSPDLTEIHPKDRKDLLLYIMNITDEVFPKTSALVKLNPSIVNASILGFAPQSQMYTHVDTVELPPYATVNWLSMFMPIKVPSFNSSIVGVKIGDNIYSHKDTIVFDAQIPHSAWNFSNEWWISIRLSVLKSSNIEISI
jgi:hypothetical protein